MELLCMDYDAPFVFPGLQFAYSLCVDIQSFRQKVLIKPSEDVPLYLLFLTTSPALGSLFS